MRHRYPILGSAPGRELYLEPRLLEAPVAVSPAVGLPPDEIPPPDPEPDPGPFPGEDPPIVYPPLPPSGPVGPG